MNIHIITENLDGTTTLLGVKCMLIHSKFVYFLKEFTVQIIGNITRKYGTSTRLMFVYGKSFRD